MCAPPAGRHCPLVSGILITTVDTTALGPRPHRLLPLEIMPLFAKKSTKSTVRKQGPFLSKKVRTKLLVISIKYYLSTSNVDRYVYRY